MQPEGKNAQHSFVSSTLTRLNRNLFPSLPAVFAFPAAPSDGPTLTYPSDPAYLPVESSYAPDAAPALGAVETPGVGPETESAAEAHDVAQQPEQPEDEQQLPRQIHIQQHLKLHFHNQGKFHYESSSKERCLNPFTDCLQSKRVEGKKLVKMIKKKWALLHSGSSTKTGHKMLHFLFEKISAMACNIMYAQKTLSKVI